MKVNAPERLVPNAANPLNAPEDFDQRYFDEMYGVTECKPFSQHWWAVRLYAGISRRLMRRIARENPSEGARPRILEVGCGFGFLLAALEAEFETTGVDISDHAVEQCRHVAPKSRSAVANLEHEVPADLADMLPKAGFDLILARYVFEHLHDPLAAMRRVVSLLRPGGYFFFSVPNTESLGARWKGSAWYALQDPTHCSLLPPETWLGFVREAGLELRREFSDGYWDLPYVKWLPRWAQLPIFLGPSALACLLARPILPARFGENVIVIAQKGE